MFVTAMSLFAALALPVPLAAQHTRYKLIDLGTFGGPQNYLYVPDNYNRILNNRGTVVGSADTSMPDPFAPFCFNEDCFVSHAFQWQKGVLILTDLGALPGGASSLSTWISPNGLIAGISQNGEIDRLNPSFPQVRAVLWKNGQITNLGTLPGGYESWANAVNSRGQVVGLATNTVRDDDSLLPPTQARAFLWQNGVMQDLGTLGGNDAVATLVNEQGQIVGESYTSSAPSAYCAQIDFPLTTGAFLWQNGQMTNLGSFGGTCTFASDLNNRGQVVGLSTLSGDLEQHPFLWDQGVLTDLGTFGGSRGNAIANNEAGEIVGWAMIPGDEAVRAFHWKNGTMTDLGAVDSDPCSDAFAINSASQIIGISGTCDFENVRGFLLEKGGAMTDLDSFVPPESALHLELPIAINDRGEIAGLGFLPSGHQHAFLLIPCGLDDTEGCQDAQDSSATHARIAFPAPTPNLNPRGLPTGHPARLSLGHHIPLRAPSYVTGTTGSVKTISPSGALTSNKSSKPTIISFSPTSGPVGTQVLINGTGLTQTSKVTFGGVAATTFTVNSDTQVTATVPTGAVTGKIAITTPGGVARSSGSFTVTTGQCGQVGAQCGASILPPCCPGLTCVPASTRAFCERVSSASSSTTGLTTETRTSTSCEQANNNQSGRILNDTSLQ